MRFEMRKLLVEMPDETIVKVPYFTCGSREPVLYIQAAQHGVELTGIYTIKLLMEELRREEKLDGRLILVPVANPLAVRWRRHFYKMELGEPYSSEHPHQMNRLWPGKRDGNETERLAYAIYENLVSGAEYVIDLHCWEMWRCSAALGLEWDKASTEMCRYSLLEFVSLSPKSRFTGRFKGVITYVVTEAGGHAMTIEHSGQRWVFKEEASRICNGILNVMRYLGMIKGEPIMPQEQFIVGRSPHKDLYAPKGEWLIILNKGPGDRVDKGEEVVKLVDLNTLSEEVMVSPIRGVIYEVGATRPNVDTRPSEEVLVIPKGERYRVATIYESKS